MVISKLPQCTPHVLVESLDAISALRSDATKQRIAEYVGKTPDYVRRALLIGAELGVLEQDEDIYRIPNQCNQDSETLLREALGDYQPFVFFCLRINKGDTDLVASRKVKALYQYENTPEGIANFFGRWGIASDLLKEVGGRVTLNFTLRSPLSVPFTSDLLDRISARTFVLDNLNSYAGSISDHEVDLLTNSALKFKSDPRGSIDDAGRAVEDQLRTLSKKAGVDVSKKGGIIEIVNEMRSKNKDHLHSKHWEIFTILGHMRNMSTHSKDRLTELPWAISPELALSYCVMSIRALRSAYVYINEAKKQDF